MQKEDKKTSDPCSKGFASSYFKANVLKPLAIVSTIFVLSNWCGFIVVISYGVTIFEASDHPVSDCQDGVPHLRYFCYRKFPTLHSAATTQTSSLAVPSCSAAS